MEQRYLSERPLGLPNLAVLLQSLDTQMSQLDLDRERPVFSQRLRDEWEDALIKRYLHKDGGDIGPGLTEDERRQAIMAMAGSQGMPHEMKVEQMRKRFTLNQRNAREIDEFKDMEECMETLFQKY